MDAKTQEMLIGLGKDWLAGGVSAGVSKTAVAPIGEDKSTQQSMYGAAIYLSLSLGSIEPIISYLACFPQI